ncbi:MAG: hypothetical protein HKN50_07365 [Gammaproteobacteria bacterium]|nr:hypothetical protein [Gammaproteobacteria bacterium]
MKYDLDAVGFSTLSIYPTKHGFSFAYFENPEILSDWGNVSARGAAVPAKIAGLMDRFSPEVVVTNQCDGENARTSERARSTIRSVIEISERRVVQINHLNRKDILSVFSIFAATRKIDVARVIAIWFPELANILPPPSKVWMDESRQMGIFDAVALAIAHYRLGN